MRKLQNLVSRARRRLGAIAALTALWVAAGAPVYDGF